MHIILIFNYIYILLSLTLSRLRSGLSISKLQVADSEREQEEPEEHENNSDSDEETDLLPNARCRCSRFFARLEKRQNTTQHVKQLETTNRRAFEILTELPDKHF